MGYDSSRVGNRFACTVDFFNADSTVKRDAKRGLFFPCHPDQLLPLPGAADIIRQQHPVIEWLVLSVEYDEFILIVQGPEASDETMRTGARAHDDDTLPRFFIFGDLHGAILEIRFLAHRIEQ